MIFITTCSGFLSPQHCGEQDRHVSICYHRPMKVHPPRKIRREKLPLAHAARPITSPISSTRALV
ncbi:hypothetical protein B0T14DRAFT_522546 [Immersiella caudata]|uniref:Uncharacterized protein n=1 Tax=Immersiella caudata TaxID=314043 RepID=A0AA39WSW5_9PEZI|nr:hypothetical protein B0T14DRAFT_522546 [Immersiella caudata]